MAKYKKRYYKKKVLTALSKYSRRKLHYVCTLYWNNGTLYIDGQEQNTMSIGDILSGNTSEFQTLGKQFAQVKLRGIYIEAVPASASFTGYNFGLCLGQANDSITFGNVRTQPNVMLLSTNVKTKMFIPISGSFTSTNSIQLFTNMVLIPFAEGNPTVRFCIRITLYLTFKTSL